METKPCNFPVEGGKVAVTLSYLSLTGEMGMMVEDERDEVGP